MKVVFLYTEIADYFLAACKALLKKGVVVHIIRWPVNKEAPFKFIYPEGLHIYERSDYDYDQLECLIEKINPDIIVCSGWIDKGYMSVCKKFKHKITTVIALDNHWRGNIKQRIASMVSPFYLKRRFSKCWVPGQLQYQYALKLGFTPSQIETGFYSCDFELFHSEYLKNKEQKLKHFPKRFLYVGRYYEFKGIKDLWAAFIELQKEEPNDWELWCLGTGDVEPVKHDKIKHFGFIQPQELPEFIKKTGVFVLPSHFEPWGVVVHEFAAAGFPVICSDEVGARVAFVEQEKNGYIYKAGNKQELKQRMKDIMKSPDSKLLEFSHKSVEKAKENTPEIWADKLIKMILNK